MKPDSDITMDSLLRQHARRAQTRPVAAELTVSGGHLDADEMNSYAENALPPAARLRYMAHLADCTPCRQTVTQLTLAAGIVFQEENMVAAAPVKPPTLAVTETTVSWRDWFTALLNPAVLRYAAPAVILLAVTVGAFIALRRGQSPASVETTQQVARNDENYSTKTAPAAVPSATKPVDEAPPPIIHDAPLAPAPPVVSPSAGPAAVSKEKPAAAKDNAVGQATEPVATRERRDAEAAKGEGPADDNKAKVAKPRGDNDMVITVTPAVTMSAPATSPMPLADTARNSNTIVIDGADKTAGNDALATGGASAEAESKMRGRAMTAASRKGPQRSEQAGIASPRAAKRTIPPPASAKADEEAPPAQRTIAGHTFTRRNGAWIDQGCVNGCTTKTLRRGSDDYKKAAAGLRSIADQLGGTVVIVWQGQAYRIQ